MTFALCLQIAESSDFPSPYWTSITASFLRCDVPAIDFRRLSCCVYHLQVGRRLVKVTDTTAFSLEHAYRHVPLPQYNPRKTAVCIVGQGLLQALLLAIAGVCVPWMLCVKPYLLWKEMKAVEREGYRGLPGNDDDYGSRHDDLEGEEEGRAIAADTDDEHVSFFLLLSNRQFVAFWFHGSSRS